MAGSTSALLQHLGVGGTASHVQQALANSIGYITAPSQFAPLTPPQSPTAPVPSTTPSAGAVTGQAGGFAPGPGGDVNAQLIQGFKDSGRPDLAAMVNTPAFNRWIQAESGGRPGAVSAANNQGLPNGGLFQFWRGHSWTAPYFQGNTFTMTPYQQAQAAAKYFHLTPQKITGYASQIANHSYRGWG